MIVTWRYRPRDTFVQRLDPRTRILFAAAAFLCLVMVWDVRIMLGWMALTLLFFGMARLTYEETRRFWLIVIPLLFCFALLTAITGRDLGPEIAARGEHWLARYPVSVGGMGTIMLGLSVERLVFAVAQFGRMFSLAMLGLLLTSTIDPATYGAAFHRLGLNDRFAYATDLAFRLVPTVASDFQMTMDAQRARGYELDRNQNIFTKVRNLAPMVVPVTIGTIMNGEEIIDAMDLRAFGAVPKRSWVVQLEYARHDYLVLAAGLLLIGLTIIFRLVNGTAFWVPEALVRLVAS